MSEQKGKSNTILIKQNDALDLDVASDTKSFQNKKISVLIVQSALLFHF